MKPNLKRLLNFLFIALTLGLVLSIAFSENEMVNAWQALFTLQPLWMTAALLGWFANLFFDALSVRSFLRREEKNISLPAALHISLTGLYYSNLTPGASGGQPMQIYDMSKRGIPVGIASSCLSLKFFCSQLMIVLIAVTLWICNPAFVEAQLGGVKWIFVIGLLINFAAVPLVLLIALYRPLVQAMVNGVIRLGGKLHICKNPDQTILKAAATLDTYHASILRLKQHPAQILLQLFFALLSLLGLFSIPVSVYYAFGQSGTPWYHLLAVSALLFCSVSYTPLPGASGAQEGGFLVFYQGLFAPGTLRVALLVWRLVSYYLFLISGAAMTVIDNVRSARRKAAAGTKETATRPAE